MNTISIAQQNDRKIALWLLCVSGVVFFMIILGGVTRLTHSGLSMVDWKPLLGILPPLSTDQWLATFEHYKQFPEYQKINKGMTLGEFKGIYYFEYFHRLLGRLIGVIFLIPFLVFWLKGIIRKPLVPKIAIMFILGGLQGLLGWYMVKSGLVDNPMVSQYRLTAHLMAAVLIYSYMLWVAFGLLSNEETRDYPSTLEPLFKFGIVVTALIVFMIASGGFVAGTRSGLVYNTWPLMAGKLVPEGMYTLQPFWLNWFENAMAIQFNHRLIAYLLVVVISVFCVSILINVLTRSIRIAALLLLAILFVQVTLGISTLLLRVPVAVAASHQGVAIVLLTVALFITRQLSEPFHNRY